MDVENFVEYIRLQFTKLLVFESCLMKNFESCFSSNIHTQH